jgi:hypothetical protein
MKEVLDNIVLETGLSLEGRSISPDSLRRLPRSELVRVARDVMEKFCYQMQALGFPLEVVGESMENIGILAKAVAAKDKNWRGESLIELRRNQRREAVIQKEKRR